MCLSVWRIAWYVYHDTFYGNDDVVVSSARAYLFLCDRDKAKKKRNFIAATRRRQASVGVPAAFPRAVMLSRREYFE